MEDIQKYEFKEVDEFSKEATTKEIIPYLESLETTEKVKDVSEDVEYRKKDVDLILINKDGSEITIEVKADRQMHRTNNFFLETISNDVKKTLGCFLYSEAKEFYYYDSHDKIIYIITLEPARDWFLQRLIHFKEVATSTKDEMGFVIYRTIGRLVSKDILLKENFVRIVKL